MFRILKVIVPVFAVALMATCAVQAQTDGYRFGVGLGYSGYGRACHDFPYPRNFLGLAIAPTPRIDAPPFFAQFPPVYYSQDIIARPYGVSPYAAPAGIMPVEMEVSRPVIQVNPYYAEPNSGDKPDIKAQPKPTPANSDTGAKTTWIPNPYYQSIDSPAGDEVALK